MVWDKKCYTTEILLPVKTLLTDDCFKILWQLVKLHKIWDKIIKLIFFSFNVAYPRHNKNEHNFSIWYINRNSTADMFCINIYHVWWSINVNLWIQNVNDEPFQFKNNDIVSSLDYPISTLRLNLTRTCLISSQYQVVRILLFVRRINLCKSSQVKLSD